MPWSSARRGCRQRASTQPRRDAGQQARGDGERGDAHREEDDLPLRVAQHGPLRQREARVAQQRAGRLAAQIGDEAPRLGRIRRAAQRRRVVFDRRVASPGRRRIARPPWPPSRRWRRRSPPRARPAPRRGARARTSFCPHEPRAVGREQAEMLERLARVVARRHAGIGDGHAIALREPRRAAPWDRALRARRAALPFAVMHDERVAREHHGRAVERVRLFAGSRPTPGSPRGRRPRVRRP